jgi:hypothetical protein
VPWGLLLDWEQEGRLEDTGCAQKLGNRSAKGNSGLTVGSNGVLSSVCLQGCVWVKIFQEFHPGSREGERQG